MDKQMQSELLKAVKYYKKREKIIIEWDTRDEPTSIYWREFPGINTYFYWRRFMPFNKNDFIRLQKNKIYEIKHLFNNDVFDDILKYYNPDFEIHKRKMRKIMKRIKSYTHTILKPIEMSFYDFEKIIIRKEK